MEWLDYKHHATKVIDILNGDALWVVYLLNENDKTDYGKIKQNVYDKTQLHTGREYKTIVDYMPFKNQSFFKIFFPTCKDFKSWVQSEIEENYTSPLELVI